MLNNMPGKYCSVVHCHNHDDEIKKWEKSICEAHGMINGLEHCDCKPPFVLLSFPTKDISLRNEWIKRVNCKDWQPNYDTHICSVHFKEYDLLKKKISPNYPYPTVNMGYELSESKKKQKRKPPVCHISSPPMKKKSHLKMDVPNVSTEIPLHAEEKHDSISCTDCKKHEDKIRKLQKEVNYWQTLYF